MKEIPLTESQQKFINEKRQRIMIVQQEINLYVLGIASANGIDDQFTYRVEDGVLKLEKKQ